MTDQQPYKPRGVRVPPLSAKKIRTFAEDLRVLFQIETPDVDVLWLLEDRLSHFGVCFTIEPREEMGQDHALTYPNMSMIQVRADVYEGAARDNPRDRFTILHEIGHWMLHPGASLARANGPRNWKPYEDSEWQADTFAAEFGMPVQYVIEQCRCPTDVMRLFRVSEQAAQIRWRNLEREGLIKK